MQTPEVIADRFRNLEEVARGGVGIVYRAHDDVSGTTVAVKVIAAESGVAPTEEARLIQEGQTLQRLVHPHVVRVMDCGRVGPDGPPYLAMEWLDGEDLASFVRRQALELRDSLEIARQIAGALHAAHGIGIVHRDVKPANIQLTRLGSGTLNAKLVDFGVAHDADANPERAGDIVGTPAYMPPEQARGEAELNASSDIYSLGATLFELIAGRPPHVGPNALATLARLVTTPAPRLSDLRPNIPRELDELVEEMLATEPGDRPQSAQHVADRLVQSIANLSSLPSAKSEEPSLRLGSSATRLITTIVALGFPTPEARDQALESARSRGAEPTPLRQDSLVAHLGAQRAVGNEAVVGLALARELADAGAKVGIASGRARVRQAGENAVRPVGEVVDRATALARDIDPGVALADVTTSELGRGAYEFKRRSDGSALIGAPVRRTKKSGGAPFVGREPELKRILSALERSIRDHTPTLVTVTGPAGIGKSRLRREVLSRVSAGDGPPSIVVQRSTAYGSRDALGAASDVLRNLTGLPKGATPGQAQAAIENRVGPQSKRGRGASGHELLAQLLSNESPGELGVAGARDRLWLAMTDVVLSSAEQSPVVIVLEDIQWADDESVVFMDHVMARAEHRALAVIAIMRPEFWPNHPDIFSGRDHTRLILRPISQRSTLALARAVLGEDAPQELIARIAAQSAGLPLFAEELARVAARGEDTSNAATIEAAIQVSLDALDELQRDAVGRLSVFGLAGWDRGLEALGFTPASETLAQLAAAEVLVEQDSSRFEGAREWTFKHALVREVAYTSLGEAERAELHGLAGRWLASVGEDAAVVARHLDLADLDEEAAPHFARAARRALATNALKDAMQMAEKALAFAETAEEGFDRAQCLDEAWSRFDPTAGERETAIWALEENVFDEASRVRARGARARYADAKGSGAATIDDLSEVRDAAATLGLHDEEARCGAALASRLALAGRFVEAEAEALRLLKLAENEAAGEAAVDGYQTLAITHQTQGALIAALEARRSAARAARGVGLTERESILTTNLGFALTTIGARQEARSLLESGLALANKIGSSGAIRHAQMVLLGWAATFGNDKSLDAVLSETRAEADRAANAVWTAPDRENLGILFYRGCELLAFGGHDTLEQSRALLRMSSDAYQQTGNRDVLPAALGMTALAVLRCGEPDAALELAKQAAELLKGGAPSLLNESPIYLALHEAHLSLGHVQEAQQAVEQAIPALLRRLRGLASTPYAQLFLTELGHNAELVSLADDYELLPEMIHEILERSPSWLPTPRG